MANMLIARLTEAQTVCLLFVATGARSKEFAPLTPWTHRTIDQYLHFAFKKLEVGSRREACQLLLNTIDEEELRRLQLRFPALAVLSKSYSWSGGDDSQADLSKQPPSRKSRLKLPPLGGKTHDLKWQDRLSDMGMAALFIAVPAFTAALLVVGTLRLLA